MERSTIFHGKTQGTFDWAMASIAMLSCQRVDTLLTRHSNQLAASQGINSFDPNCFFSSTAQLQSADGVLLLL